MAKDYITNMIGKTPVKFRVIRDSFDNSVDGYVLGDYKLVKYYGWGNDYSWLIAKKDTRIAWSNCEFWKQCDNKEFEFVNSCKAGKERLVELYIEGVSLY